MSVDRRLTLDQTKTKETRFGKLEVRAHLKELMDMDADPNSWIAALRTSHGRLAAIVEQATPAEVEGRSYCADWSFAQVCSHLGSGAEISLAILEAARLGESAPAQEVFVSIWDRWNAMNPAEMAANSVVADERYVATAEAVSADEIAQMSIDLFGSTLDYTGLLAMRLSEHAVHVWDLEVVSDADEVLAEDAVELLVDRIPVLGRLASGDRPSHLPTTIAVTTVRPGRKFAIVVGDNEVTVAPGPAAEHDATFTAPAEAVIRLTYGRLDAAHTPAETAVDGGVTIDELRALFPGP